MLTKLPRQVEYAIIALADMQKAHPGQLFAVRALCERRNIPFDVMSKTMQRLARAKILRSVKGAGGGYQIIKDLEHVSLLDVIEAVQGAVSAVNCLTENGNCPHTGDCDVVGSMQFLDDKLKELYRTMSVLELLDSSGCSGKDGIQQVEIKT